jgi:hypothetical protein
LRAGEDDGGGDHGSAHSTDGDHGDALLSACSLIGAFVLSGVILEIAGCQPSA